jgi:hypothetical protein
VDATAPTLSFASGPTNNSITSADTATFAVNTNTGVVAYKYALDTASYPAIAGIDVNTAIDLTGLAPGVHTLFAIGRDFIGNWQKVPTRITWTVDKSAPALTITPAANPTNVKSVSGTAEPGAVLTATIDGVAVSNPLSVTVPANGNWTYPLTTITDGIHTIIVKARDTAGNEATSTVLPNFDVTAPTVTISGVGIPASPATTGATSAVFTVAANETLATYTWKLDSGSVSAPVQASQPTQLTVATGTHTLTVEGYDLAGNKGTKTLTWAVDTSQPTVVATISGAPTGKSNATTATITIGGGGVNNYRYRLVPATLAGVTSPPAGVAATPAQTVNQPASTAISITTMPEGPYILEVYGNDGAATPVEQTSPTVVAWTVDRTGPTKTVTTVSNVPASGYTNATTLNLAVGGTDVVTYRYKLVTVPAGAAATPAEDTETLVSTPIAFSTTGNLFPEGSYTLAVIGKDSAGNWQVAPSGSWWTDPGVTSVTFTVDRTVPNVFTFNPVTALTNANSQTLGGTAGDAVAPVTVNIYRGTTLVGATTPSAGVWSYTVQGLAIGVNSIRAEAVDAAGNTVSISQTIKSHHQPADGRAADLHDPAGGHHCPGCQYRCHRHQQRGSVPLPARRRRLYPGCPRRNPHCHRHHPGRPRRRLPYPRRHRQGYRRQLAGIPHHHHLDHRPDSPRRRAEPGQPHQPHQCHPHGLRCERYRRGGLQIQPRQRPLQYHRTAGETAHRPVRPDDRRPYHPGHRP